MMAKRKAKLPNELNYNVVASKVSKAVGSLICDGNFFYQYRRGAWVKLEDYGLKVQIKRHMGNKSTQRGIQETIENLRLDRRVDAGKLNSAPQLINVRNGMLDIETCQLISHDEDYLSTIQFQVNYCKDAKCPRWIKFLEEVLEGDSEKIDFLQELFGYVLIPDSEQQLLVIFLGFGGNGKSTLLYPLLRLIGEDNFSAIAIENLRNPHYRAELHGKLLNAADESETAFLSNTAVIKQIVSGDIIQADRKYGHPVKFRPYARLIFAMNALPQVRDITDGFFRRLAIIEFRKKFEGAGCNRKLKYELVEELDGIFLWAVEGLKRLRSRGYFNLPKSSTTCVDEYRKEVSSGVLFIEESCLFEDGSKERGECLYQVYREWATANGLQSLSNKKFALQISGYYGNRIRKNRDRSGVYYEGIKLKKVVQGV